MATIIFELGLSFLLTLYLLIDIVIPSFTGGNRFWFLKSFFNSEPKKTFEEEIKVAEKSYNDAKKKMENLKNSANEETEEAEKRLAKAEETLANAKGKLAKFNKK